MLVQKLSDIRADFANENITEAEFMQKINAVMQELTNRSDAEKIAAYDKIANDVAAAFSINEVSDDPTGNEIVYINDDTSHYLFETVLKAMFGKDIFAKFYNKTYYGG